MLLTPAVAPAQAELLPGGGRPALPEPGIERAPRLALPPLLPAERDLLSSGLLVPVRVFEIAGSTVFSVAELKTVLEPWTGRKITSEELLEARDAITRHYIDRGYVNSGAVVPDQEVEDGIIRIEVIEGTLTNVTVEGTRWFRRSYFRSRLLASHRDPVNLNQLEDSLQILLEDRRVGSISAELVPGELRGESVLNLAVQEASAFWMSLEVANDRSPTLGPGGNGARLQLAHENVTGFGDALSFGLGYSEGFRDYDLQYLLPLNAYGTALSLHYRRSKAKIVEENPGRDTRHEPRIVSKLKSVAIELSHPLYRTPGHQLRVGVIGERRKSELLIDGEPFPTGFRLFDSGAQISRLPPGVEDDDAIVISVLRFYQEWTARSRTQVFAARSTITGGFGALGATTTDSDFQDGRYVAWLAQIQWVRLLPWPRPGAQLLLRGDLQLANDPLVPMEKFSVGGSQTVRGYRENQLVRDNGAVGSIELRIPVIRSSIGEDILQIAPFFDIGKSWDKPHRESLQTIASLGTGIRFRPTARMRLEVYWGGQLRRSGRTLKHPGGAHGIQYHGWHVRAVLALP